MTSAKESAKNAVDFEIRSRAAREDLRLPPAVSCHPELKRMKVIPQSHSSPHSDVELDLRPRLPRIDVSSTQLVPTRDKIKQTPFEASFE